MKSYQDSNSDSHPVFRNIGLWRRRRAIQRFWKMGLLALPYLFGATFVLCSAAWIFPISVSEMAILWSLLIGIALLICAALAARPSPPVEILRDVDHSLSSADLAVTLGDASIDPAWHSVLSRKHGSQFDNIHPRSTWPLSSRPIQRIWAAACVFMGATALVTASANPVQIDKPVRVSQESTASLEEMVLDWQSVAEEIESDEFKKLIQEIEELQAAEAFAEQTPGERMEHLSRIESLVNQHRQNEKDASIAEHSDDLAALLEPVEGLSPAAAALRRKDFSGAGQTLESSTESGALPPEASSEDFERSAKELAEQGDRAGNKEFAEALKKLADAAKRRSPQEWKEGKASLGACMNREAGRQLADRLMKAQLDQLKDQKLALATSKNEPAKSLASLIGQGQIPGGLQAGSSPGGDPFNGEATATPSDSETVELTGTMGEGDSSMEVIRSSEAAGQTTRTSREAQFADYQALSEEAVRDESLPAVHRETIRRYFETIRPKSTND